MEAIIQSLRAVAIGAPQQFRNLTAFPLLRHGAAAPDYITLSQAIKNKTASITELSDDGSVPELLLNNTGNKPVLILDGEELIGAKQNRVANLTVLAAANSKTVLPVSCVEAGRWSYRSDEFALSDRAQFSRGRAAKAAALSANLKATGTHGADQSMVWNHIEEKQIRMSVRSPTAAMSDLYDQNLDDVERYVAQIKPIEAQVGVMFAIDGVIEGMDMFDAPATLAAALPKLVRSFGIDALETAAEDKQAPATDVAMQFLDRVAAAQVDSYPGVGLGTDVRLSAPLVAGGGLVHEAKLLHLVAFGIQPSSHGGRQDSSSESRLRAQRYDRMRERNKKSH